MTYTSFNLSSFDLFYIKILFEERFLRPKHLKIIVLEKKMWFLYLKKICNILDAILFLLTTRRKEMELNNIWRKDLKGNAPWFWEHQQCTEITFTWIKLIQIFPGNFIVDVKPFRMISFSPFSPLSCSGWIILRCPLVSTWGYFYMPHLVHKIRIGFKWKRIEPFFENSPNQSDLWIGYI